MIKQSQIRNFAIIAHIDHGKSTLADRMLELTGTVVRASKQTLDSNPIEQERGITIKLAPVRMTYEVGNKNQELGSKNQESRIKNSELQAKNLIPDTEYVLNLIDTPGHVDFSYEVSRALAACEGAILLVDATQGIQAQTLAHYREAKRLNLKLVPVINKIDMPLAEVDETKLQMMETFGFNEQEILQVSAKTGEGVTELLEEIVERVPAPEGQQSSALRALVFNSQFDEHQGVVAWVRVVDGSLQEKDEISFLGTKAATQVIKIEYFEIKSKVKSEKLKVQLKNQNGQIEESTRNSPVPIKTSGKLETRNSLGAGDVGYIVTGLKDPQLVQVGDTLVLKKSVDVKPLAGYDPPKPMIFASFYPLDQGEYPLLGEALEKLKLLDSSLTFIAESSLLLGNGYRIGFLGLLHAEIVQERLEREFGLSVFASAPNVAYKVKKGGDVTEIHSPHELPDSSQYDAILEPMLDVMVFAPKDYTGALMGLFQERRGKMREMKYVGSQVQFEYDLPLGELVSDFYSQLKSVSSGYASLDYQISGWQEGDLVKLDILLAGEMVPALSRIVPRSQSFEIGKRTVERLTDVVPRHNFDVSVQAAIGAKILARSNIKAFRKDVTAKLYGGDQTRKDKLLKKQKKGKAKMKQMGKVNLPPDTFWKLLK